MRHPSRTCGPDFWRTSISQVGPDKIHGMASHVINKCAGQGGGSGEFVTQGMDT